MKLEVLGGGGELTCSEGGFIFVLIMGERDFWPFFGHLINPENLFGTIVA